MPKKTRTLRDLLGRWGPALLLTAGMFWLTYRVVYDFRMGMSDYFQHSVWALGLTRSDMVYYLRHGGEKLWHILVRLCFDRTHDLWAASALVTAAANAAAHFLVYCSLEEAEDEKLPRWLLALLVHLLFLVNALAWPGGPFVTDRGFVNVWHNPTNMMVRPFAAAVFFMTLRIYNRRRCGVHRTLLPPETERDAAWRLGSFRQELCTPVFTWPELILYPLCLMLATYAKPAFLQFFAPAIFLFCVADLIRTRGRLFPFCLKLAVAFLPAALILLSQFLSFFGAFAPLEEARAMAAERTETVLTIQEAMTSAHVEGYSEGNVSTAVAVYYILPQFSGLGQVLAETARALWLTLLLCAFPLAVYAIDFRSVRGSAAFRLSLWGVFAARLESLLLHELGVRESDGNFRWAYFVAVWLFWAVALERYGEIVAERSRRGVLMRAAATPLLLWHAAAGILYVVRVLATHQYWF